MNERRLSFLRIILLFITEPKWTKIPFQILFRYIPVQMKKSNFPEKYTWLSVQLGTLHFYICGNSGKPHPYCSKNE